MAAGAAASGKSSSHTWNLTVTLPGESPKTFSALRTGSNALERLTWLGFSSNATAATIFYLDNL